MRRVEWDYVGVLHEGEAEVLAVLSGRYLEGHFAAAQFLLVSQKNAAVSTPANSATS